MTEDIHPEEVVGFWRGIIMLILFVFCLVYPFMWWGKIQERKVAIAKKYIANYHGGNTKRDPWGQYYRATKVELADGIIVTIRSAGPDEKFDTEDDIVGGYKRSITVEMR